MAADAAGMTKTETAVITVAVTVSNDETGELGFSSCLFLIPRLLYYPVGACLLLLLVVSLDCGLGLFDHLFVPQGAFLMASFRRLCFSF